MKLARMSDAIVMEVARQRANGKHVLSGATLAQLKNAGVRESTLLKLVQRGVPESQGRAILAYRHRGASEAEILRRFTGS
jgi:recombinational DNA repair protein RecR